MAEMPRPLLKGVAHREESRGTAEGWDNKIDLRRWMRRWMDGKGSVQLWLQKKHCKKSKANEVLGC